MITKKRGRCGAGLLAAGLAILYAFGAASVSHAQERRGLFDLFGKKTAGEKWTIECGVYDGDDRRKVAEDFASGLKKVKGLRPEAVSVQHFPRRSVVFYGEYLLDYDKNDKIVFSPEIRKDVEFVRSLTSGDARPFLLARPTPKPIEIKAPPEWNLENAKGVYTLQIGVTYNTATFREREQAAVDWVADLRKRGYEAYYYHQPDRPLTIVTVGTFDESAVRPTDISRRIGKEDPNTVVASPNMGVYSKAVRELQSKEEFAFNLENGHKVIVRSADGKKAPLPSFLVKIPAKAESSRD